MTTFEYVILGNGILGTYALSKLHQDSSVCLIEAGESLEILKEIEIDSNIDYKSNQIRHSLISNIGQIWGGATMSWPDFAQVDSSSQSNIPIDIRELRESEQVVRNKLSITEKHRGTKIERIKQANGDSDFEVTNALITNDIHLSSIKKINKNHKNLTYLENTIGIRILNRKKHLELILLDSQVNRFFSINTKKIILAAGTIENTRILLNSDDSFSNKHLGTNLSDHLGINLGEYVLTSSIFDQESKFGVQKSQRDKWPRLRIISNNDEIESFVHATSLNNPHLPNRLDKYLSKIGLKCATELVGKNVTIQLFIEKTNDVNCKIYSNLKPEDSLLKINIDFNLLSSELNMINEIASKYHDFLITSGIATSENNSPIEIKPNDIMTTCHPSGTLRMAETPDLGLVSKKSLLFSDPNIMVLGTGVLPRAAAVHPTLVSMALAELALS
jgi:hypothetical protein